MSSLLINGRRNSCAIFLPRVVFPVQGGPDIIKSKVFDIFIYVRQSIAYNIADIRSFHGAKRSENLGEHLPIGKREPDIVLLDDSIVLGAGSEPDRRLNRRHNKILLKNWVKIRKSIFTQMSMPDG